MFFAKVYIRLKKGLLDPQGKAIEASLHSLGYKSLSETTVGKLIEFKISAKNKEEAGTKIEEMCKKLLANPVIEVHSYDLEEVK